MTDQPKNKGGRPATGISPQIAFRLTDDVLATRLAEFCAAEHAPREGMVARWMVQRYLSLVEGAGLGELIDARFGVQDWALMLDALNGAQMGPEMGGSMFGEMAGQRAVAEVWDHLELNNAAAHHGVDRERFWGAFRALSPAGIVAVEHYAALFWTTDVGDLEGWLRERKLVA